MEIIDIFAVEDNHLLLSVQFKNETSDEFTKLFSQWQNPEFLEQFFTENTNDLNKPYHRGISIEEAIFKTIEEAQELENQILDITESTNQSGSCLKFLQELFKPLNDEEIKLYPYQASKASYKKNYSSKRGWIRLYAVRIDQSTFVVSSGGIKLVGRIKESKHLIREKQKLEFAKDYLFEIGFTDGNDCTLLES